VCILYPPRSAVPGLECGPDLEVAVHNVAEQMTQPTTGLNAGGT